MQSLQILKRIIQGLSSHKHEAVIIIHLENFMLALVYYLMLSLYVKE